MTPQKARDPVRVNDAVEALLPEALRGNVSHAIDGARQQTSDEVTETRFRGPV